MDKTKDKIRCEERIYENFYSSQCQKTAKVERNGKWYCGIHDPEKVKARQDARQKKWEDKWARGKENQHQAEKLLKRLGVRGSAAYQWKEGYIRAVQISFDELEKLLAKLGK